MKTVALLVGLCVCLSSGQQWSGYQRPYQRIIINDWNSGVPQNWGYQFRPYNQKLIGGEFSPYFFPERRRPYWFGKHIQVLGSRLGPNPYDNLNTYAKSIGKNYAGNEMLRNNGIQNNMNYNSRRFFDDINVKKSADRNLVQVLNKRTWGQTECYGILEIIKDLSLVTHSNSISEEKQNLRTLFSIIKEFVLANNLQNVPFSVVVYEIGKILLNDNDNTKPLREQEIDLILQRFKDQELVHLLLEIRSRPDITIRVAVLKLARLLDRLKQDLIVKGLSRAIVRVVITRAVQLSVPVIGYYFEKECKIKTQRYIVQNLEVALNLKLEGDSVVSWAGLDNSANAGQVWSMANSESLGVVGGLGTGGGSWSEASVNGLGSVINQGSPSGVGNLGTLGSVGNQGSLSGLGNVENLNALETQVGPGISVNMGNQGNLGDQGGPISTGNTQGINGFENMISPKGQGALLAQ